ncbi:unnamed protein product [Allacma fusca]|uniref:Uncharacterized protein n=1 Tax=Allacma fusca TaxID=39272 RepID=A0A8J2LLG3_9HEXA|nr:unnamed protein product [Allacma fusca]CAG7835374.1 unnamed protein product [Allacma fusca]
MSFSLAKGSFMPLFFILVLIVIFKLESSQGMVVNDLEPVRKKYACLNIDNFICVSINRAEKHLVSYRNECYFHADFQVNEAMSIVYCGLCDPKRELPKKGAKPDLKDFECLDFQKHVKN